MSGDGLHSRARRLETTRVTPVTRGPTTPVSFPRPPHPRRPLPSLASNVSGLACPALRTGWAERMSATLSSEAIDIAVLKLSLTGACLGPCPYPAERVCWESSARGRVRAAAEGG